MSKSTVVYFDAGNICLGVHDLTLKQRREFDKRAMEEGHVGYLSGYHQRWSGDTDTVIVYFKKRPKWSEIIKRRNNGFKAAQWYSLNLNRKYQFMEWLDRRREEAEENRDCYDLEDYAYSFHNGMVSAFREAIDYIKEQEEQNER
jgi:hypothetical protein